MSRLQEMQHQHQCLAPALAAAVAAALLVVVEEVQQEWWSVLHVGSL